MPVGCLFNFRQSFQCGITGNTPAFDMNGFSRFYQKPADDYGPWRDAVARGNPEPSDCLKSLRRLHLDLSQNPISLHIVNHMLLNGIFIPLSTGISFIVFGRFGFLQGGGNW